MAFGDIENVTYFFLRTVPTDTLHETASTLPLGKRVDLIIELLSGQPKLSDKRKETFAKLLREAKALSGRRNVLAHSPLVMEGYHHPKYGWFKPIRILSGSVKTKDKVTLKRLRKQLQEAEKLAERLYREFSRISKATADRRRVGP